jgi:hypothetical protein
MRHAIKIFRRQQSTVALAGNVPRMPAKKRDFAAEVNAVKKWWQSDRFKDTVRPYKAEVHARQATSAHRSARTRTDRLIPLCFRLPPRTGRGQAAWLGQAGVRR